MILRGYTSVNRKPFLSLDKTGPTIENFAAHLKRALHKSHSAPYVILAAARRISEIFYRI